MHRDVGAAISLLLFALSAWAQSPEVQDTLSRRPAGTAGVADPSTATHPPVIVIDPGHGGEDAGVKGRGGIQEKQVTLATARRVRELIEMRLGARVVLTREDDTAVGLDARVVAANGNRAALFLSLHLNGSPSSDVAGAVVYSLKLGREGEQIRREGGRNALAIAQATGGTRAVQIVPWIFAQARHTEESATLAAMVAEALGSAPALRSAAAVQAPLRVLSDIDAPAALVELAYLTNTAQEQLVASDEFQAAAAEALFSGVARFMLRLEEGGGR